MKIRSVSCHEVRLAFVVPMVTALGRQESRLVLFVRVEAVGGYIGWGECAAQEDDSYFWETVALARTSIDGAAIGSSGPMWMWPTWVMLWQVLSAGPWPQRRSRWP